MKLKKGKELLQPFIDEADKDNDPYLLVHFSRQEDKFTGLHERLDKMDAQIIMKELVKFFEFDELDIEVLKDAILTV